MLGQRCYPKTHRMCIDPVYTGAESSAEKRTIVGTEGTVQVQAGKLGSRESKRVR